MKQKSMIVYLDTRDVWEALGYERAGMLILALMRLADTGEETTFDDPELAMAYRIFSKQLKRDQEKYAKVCEARKVKAKKGGAPKLNQNAAKQPDAKELAKFGKQPDNDNVNDNENENVNDNANENDNANANENVNVTEKEKETFPTPTPHPTNTQQTLTIEDILERTRERGYAWSREEAESFLRFNEERGRTGDWDFAIERWESRRYKNPPAPEGQGEKRSLGTGMLSDADYESLVNRF